MAMAANPQPFPVDQVDQFAGIVGIHAGDALASFNRLETFRIGHIHKVYRLRGQLGGRRVSRPTFLCRGNSQWGICHRPFRCSPFLRVGIDQGRLVRLGDIHQRKGVLSWPMEVQTHSPAHSDATSEFTGKASLFR